MSYFQLLPSSDPGRWYLKNLWDAAGQRLDARVFGYGNLLNQTPYLRIPAYDGTLTNVQFPLRIDINTQGNKLDFTLGPSAVPIVTEAVSNLLQTFEHNIQFIPVEIEGQRNSYFIANVFSNIECIDETQSRIEWRPDSQDMPHGRKPIAIYKLVVNPQQVDARHLFRMKRWHAPLIASEKLKEALQANGFSGIEFEPV